MAKDYKWSYSRVGGVTRVNIATGEDIAHLGELDKKKWSVLSCPVKGLEIDDQSLKYVDSNNDGSIRVDEVVNVANWLTRVLKKNDILFEATDQLPLDLINQEDAEGKVLFDTATMMLKELGKGDEKVITLADTHTSLDAIRKNKLEAAIAALDKNTTVEAPYGDATDAVEAAYKALDAKVNDYFMRSRLAGFAQESVSALDVQVSRIEAISAENLASKVDEIASYPIARLTAEAEPDVLPLNAAFNPAWVAQMKVIIAALPANTDALTPALWTEIGAKIKAYRDYQASIDIKESDIILDEESANTQKVDKLLHLVRDFAKLLRNYVTLQDLYDPKTQAIFQAGTLIVDQRACTLCMLVADPGAQAAQAPKSGMYLLFCDCVSKSTGKAIKILAAVTVGDVDDLFVGKNAIFYDRQGNDYDARITSIVENPISVPQAMWTPYKKFARFVEDQINKFAAEKESGVMNDATTSFTERTEAAKTAQAEGGTAQDAGKAATSGFDIAKFAGIFAAIGMAIGMIGSALVAVAKGFFGLDWWQMPLVILAIMLVISGPSMFIAWTKLRRRNLAPVLNANGWAVNASAKINIPFGATLTQQAKFPMANAKMKDPFADKGMSPWLKALIWVVVVCGICAGVLYLNCKYHWFKVPFCCSECVADTEVVCDGASCEDCAAAPADSIQADSTLVASVVTE